MHTPRAKPLASLVRSAKQSPARTFSTSSKRNLTQDGQYLVLGIETSCDDSCVSLVSAPPSYITAAHLFASQVSTPQIDGKLNQERPRARIISSIVLKQSEHNKTRGVSPLPAAHLHSKNLPRAISLCLEEGVSNKVLSQIYSEKPGHSTHTDSSSRIHAADEARKSRLVVGSPAEVDAIAVTQGPGMPGCLTVGLGAAKVLSSLWGIPIVYTHHMVAHALSPLLASDDLTQPQRTAIDGQGAQDFNSSARIDRRPISFPYLVLLLSGGHTQVVLCSGPKQFQILATTTDEAIGRCTDKISRQLVDLHVSDDDKVTGDLAPGKRLEMLAELGNDPAMAKEIPHYDVAVSCRGEPMFSYSGLHTRLDQLIAAEHAKISENSSLSDDTGFPLASRIPLPTRIGLARAFQTAAFAQLTDKVRMTLAPRVAANASSAVQEQHVRHNAESQARMEASHPSVVAFSPEPRKSGKSYHTRLPGSKLIDTRIELPFGLQPDQIKHLIVAGGVASNAELRRALHSSLADIGRQDVSLYFPPVSLCTDNAAMIAHAALLDWDNRTWDLSPSPRGKWSVEDLAFGQDAGE
ncbi:Predicted metalloprotease with chaperone activity (RNAse H/HSP70 fold) [Ceraceosorus bombacis]|uniref:Predicted metalloprotease with chaperone activity (RNAse H/HSP70 fold) n=1 Tax=Ceraceosorus bombacis TaxID=401625 RepID=A0A0P1BTI9_9BASI|nr:Predicted metalloprotease with chaperone activity (RNAse H/HSP70 fold) [Ceraceosorus bombacis]